MSDQVAGVIAGAMLAVVGVIYGHWAKRRTDRETAKYQLLNSNNSFKIESKKVDLETLTQVVAVMQGELKRVTDRVDTLQKKFDTLATKYWKAVHYIRLLQHKIRLLGHEPPEVPVEIRDDI